MSKWDQDPHLVRFSGQNILGGGNLNFLSSLKRVTIFVKPIIPFGRKVFLHPMTVLTQFSISYKISAVQSEALVS